MNLQKLANFTPVGFVIILVLWSYYSYYLTLFELGYTTAPLVVCLIFMHIFLGLFMLSYYKVITTKPGVPSASMNPPLLVPLNGGSQEYIQQNPIDIEQALADVYFERKQDGTARYCGGCNIYKPDRAHHCSHCGTCILKFDHHCPWVNNCVGWGNYKYFLLFIIYGALYCILLFGTTFNPSSFNVDGTQMVQSVTAMLLPIVSGIFGLVLLVFAMVHLNLLATNTTTLESMGWPITIRLSNGNCVSTRKNIYNVGYQENIKSVLGDYSWKWFVPVFSSKGNGHVFNKNQKIMESLENLQQPV